MANSKEIAAQFRKLHVAGNPLVLYNIWDAGSAKAVATSGATAIATGSWAVAHANGFEDGEQVPLDLVMANLERIARAVSLPVSLDIESGYGATPAEVAVTIERSIAAGAIGCNIEDSVPGDGALRRIGEQAERIAQARKSADALNDLYFINARTDVFFQAGPRDDDVALAQVLERAKAYSLAGANGLFVPGLSDVNLIRRLVSASPLPINIMVDGKTPPLQILAQAGVSRISFGAGPYLQMMKALTEAAKVAMTVS